MINYTAAKDLTVKHLDRLISGFKNSYSSLYFCLFSKQTSIIKIA